MHLIRKIIGIFFLLSIYLIPTGLVFIRHQRFKTLILLLNLLFGWTGIGWLVALFWAYKSPKILTKSATFTTLETVSDLTVTDDFYGQAKKTGGDSGIADATASRHGRSSWDDYADSSLYWAYELGAPTDLFYELSEVFRIAYPSINQNDKIRHSAERAQQESVVLVQLEELTDSLKGFWENGDNDVDEFYRLFNELSNSTIRLHYTAYEKYRNPVNYLSSIRRGIGKIMAMDQMLRRQDREGGISYLTRLRDGLQRRSPAGSPPDLGLLFILTRYVSEILLGLLSKIQNRQEVNASNAVFTTEFAVSFSNTVLSVIGEKRLAWGGDLSKWEAGRSAFRASIFLSCELDKIKHNAIFEALTDNSISRELKFYAGHYLAALQKKEASFKLSAGERLLFSYSVGYVATTNRSTRTYQSTSKTEGGEYHSNTVHWGHGVSNTQGTLSPRTRRTNSLTETSSHRAWADEKPADLMITSRQLWFSTHDKTVGSTINLSNINSMTPSEEGLHFIRGTRSTPEQFVQARFFADWGTEPDPFLAKTAALAWRQGQEIEERANELIAEAEDGNNLGEWNLYSAAIENRIDVVSALILRGDDINDWSSFPLLALHAVAEKDHVDLARFLIAKGAEIDNMGQTDQTPLQVASRSYSHGVARLLIENGAATTGIDLSWMENQ